MADRPEYFDVNTNSQPAQGLVFGGLGRFSGSTYYRDSSLYGNHGTLTNMGVPATATSGWELDNFLGRRVLNFDGTNDYVTMGVVPAAAFTTNFTVSLWVYPTSIAQYDCFLVNCDQAGHGYRLWTRDASAHKWYWEIYDGGTKNTVSAEAITLNAWSHVSAVHDGAYLRLFVNGVASGTPTSCGAVDYTPAGVPEYVHFMLCDMLNSVTGTRGRCPATKITDPLLHGRVLSTAEIQQLADPSNTMLSGLVLPPKRRIWAVVVGGTPATTIRWPWQQRRHRRMAGVS